MEAIVTELVAEGYTRVTFSTAQHASTLKLFVEDYHKELLDITYVWSRMYVNIPFLVAPSGMHFVAPQYQCIDTYSAIIDFQSLFKIEQNLERVALLEALYLSLPHFGAKKQFQPDAAVPKATDALRAKALEFFSSSTSGAEPRAIVIGEAAYNAYMEASELPDRGERSVPTGEIQVIAKTGTEDAILDALVAHLKVKAGFRVAMYRPQLEHYRSRLELQVDGAAVLTMFGFDYCVPYRTVAVGSLKIALGTFRVVLRMLYVCRFGATVERERNAYSRLTYMIYNMYYGRDAYYRRRQTNGYEERAGIFYDFSFECLGEGFVHVRTSSRLARLKSPGVRYNYVPGKPITFNRPPFANTSGRLFAYRDKDGVSLIRQDAGDDKAASGDAPPTPP
jgi:hypothetical protein